MMKTRAAVLRKGGQPWEITELDLDEPKAGEVLIRFEAAGLCHSDEHIRATGTARTAQPAARTCATRARTPPSDA